MLPLVRIWPFRAWGGPLLLLLLLLLLPVPAAAVGPAPAQTRAGEGLEELAQWPLPGAAAIAVLEANSGRMLFSMNGDTPLPPASTTKIATALLVLSLSEDLSRLTRVSPAAAAVGESSLYLRAGEELSLADLLAGALVHSGNDACFALAEAVAGSEPLFVHWLNMQALVLGAYSCHFCNTNGLPDDGHVISAADLALITVQAMEQPFFAQTVASKQVELGGGASYRYYKNTNKLLWQDGRVCGVKTGTTDAAGPCLVAALQEGAALYISVVFDCPDRYGSSRRLLEYAADHYMLLRPIQAGQALAWDGRQLLYAGEEAELFLPRQQAGRVSLRWELPHRLLFLDHRGRELKRLELTAGNV